jgi:hypothetical protein
VNLDSFNRTFALWKLALRRGLDSDPINGETRQGAAQRFEGFSVYKDLAVLKLNMESLLTEILAQLGVLKIAEWESELSGNCGEIATTWAPISRICASRC